MRQAAQKVLIQEIQRLSTFPTYDQAVAIVRKLENADECWYGWLYERQVIELIAEVWKQVNK